jgi:hypothetical protein
VSPHGGLGIIPQAGLNRKKAWDSGPEKKQILDCPANVRFWLLTDSFAHPEKLPLYPRKRTFLGFS